MKLFVIDVGATKIRLGSSDGRRLVQTEIHSTPKLWLEARKLLVGTRKVFFGRRHLDRVIIGVPGMVTQDRKKVLRLPKLPAWPTANFVSDLRRALNAPVVVENDAVLNGIGEAHFGAGRGRRIVGFLTLSTGVNGTRIVDGQPEAHAFPVELHHLLVRYKNQDQSLGRAISGDALERRFGRPSELVHSKSEWNAVTETLAGALVNLGVVWAPNIIVLGGSVSKSISLSKLRRSVRTQWHHRFPPPQIVKGKLGERSGLYGSLVLAQLKSKR